MILVIKYQGPTEKHGSRIVVRSKLGRSVTAYNHGLDVDGNNERAAIEHAKKCGVPGGSILKAGTVPGRESETIYLLNVTSPEKVFF